MFKPHHFTRAALMLLTIGFLASCGKKDEVQPANEQDFVSAKATVDLIAELNAVNEMSMSFSQTDNKSERSASGRTAALRETTCGAVTGVTDESTGNQTFTVDFGKGTTCEDKVLRKGKIIFTVLLDSMSFSEDNNFYMGVSSGATFANYEADGKKLEGSHSTKMVFTNKSLKYDIQFKNGVLTYEDGSKVQWNSTYAIQGSYNAQNPEAAIKLSMTGGLAGADRKGKIFTADITSPLLLDSSCQYSVTSGRYLIASQDYSALYDFGNGECDAIATLAINGKTEQIALK